MHGISPVVSVIMPVYNGERFLEECIKSVLNQTFVEFELLIIDDGSTDATAMICQDFAALDSRVRVFYRENSGVSRARNFGIDRAQGAYLSFVDADDILLPDALQNMLKLVQDSNADIVSTNYEVFDQVNRKSRTHLHDRTGVIKGSSLNAFIKDIVYGISGTYVWLLLVKRSSLGNVRFRIDIAVMEDSIFYLDILNEVGEIYISNVVTYRYRNNSNSVSRSIKKIDGIVKNMLRVAGLMKGYVSGKDIPVMSAYRANIIANYCVNALQSSGIKSFTRVYDLLSSNKKYQHLIAESDLHALPIRHRVLVDALSKKRYARALVVSFYRAAMQLIKNLILKLRR